VKVYPRGVHNLMETPEPEGSSWIRSKRFVPGFFEEMWTGRSGNHVRDHRAEPVVELEAGKSDHIMRAGELN
jgi:hypothetical protein